MLWISPEILRSGNIQGSKEADIYSFAIVCSELVNCEIAWHDPRDEKDIEGFKWLTPYSPKDGSPKDSSPKNTLGGPS